MLTPGYFGGAANGSGGGGSGSGFVPVASLPATAAVGDAVVLPDGRYFVATATNTWAEVLNARNFSQPVGVAVSDETTNLTTGTAKTTFRAPFAGVITAIRANLATASSSGLVTVDVNKNGTTILSTKLSIDANEKTSLTAATPAVISDSALANDDELTIDIDAAGTGARGLKLWFFISNP